MGRASNDGRSNDVELGWLTRRYGLQWEHWRSLAAEWLSQKEKNLSNLLSSLTLFFETYLVQEIPWTADVEKFFEGACTQKCSSDDFKEVVLRKTRRKDNNNLSTMINLVTDFLEWVLDNYFSEPDDHGRPLRLLSNPFEKTQCKARLIESVHSPLPYRYIQQLRRIICPKAEGCFRDWIWAQQATSNSSKVGSDWFDVPLELIDKNDPDCVWRTKQTYSDPKKRRRPLVTVYQMWSPVRAMMIFIKLHLPLRTYQVRMLDSGEADTWRYQCGEWQLNDVHSFARGNIKHPFSKGVFRRIYDGEVDQFATGLYINTNKTADSNKDEKDFGYTIPWQHEEVLYWLEKLRNWQERYNPIQGPTDCTTLEPKHTGGKKSDFALQEMGQKCFLFRSAGSTGSDCAKPLIHTAGESIWYQLLLELESQLYEQGDRLSNGERLKLVVDYPEGSKASKKATLFPLHSIRVSLITCYALQGKVPPHVIAKLLAGHSRLIMTLYYVKLSRTVMAAQLEEAQQALPREEHESLQTLLKDAEYSAIQKNTAFNDEASVEAIMSNRNPVGWENRYLGICLVGGNSSRASERKNLGSCWNGGPVIKKGKRAEDRVHGMVPHGPENCVRCRWFITDARYLPALNAHLNLISFRASEAASLECQLEGKVEALKELQFKAESEGESFQRYQELQALHRRYEKQTAECNLYAEDWIATLTLINRILEVEKNRSTGDAATKLIAVGKSRDVKTSIHETDSRLLQLFMICDDAEFYPDMRDDVMKTSIIQDRSQALCRAMMKSGYQPILLFLDKEQQLIAGNAMVRQIAEAKQSGSALQNFQQAVEYLETEEYLLDDKPLSEALQTLGIQKDRLSGNALKFIDGKLMSFGRAVSHDNRA